MFVVDVHAQLAVACTINDEYLDLVVVKDIFELWLFARCKASKKVAHFDCRDA